jgi:hypothetical protein
MNDHIGNKLDSDAPTISNVNIDPTAIYGLKAVHDKFLLQLNHHVPFEHDP